MKTKQQRRAGYLSGQAMQQNTAQHGNVGTTLRYIHRRPSAQDGNDVRGSCSRSSADSSTVGCVSLRPKKTLRSALWDAVICSDAGHINMTEVKKPGIRIA